MKKLAYFLMLPLIFLSASLSARIIIQDVSFNLNFPWQQRFSYSGLFSSSIGYSYLNKIYGNIGIYLSVRNLESADLEAFKERLQPIEEFLMPYATPDWKGSAICEILSEEETTIGDLAAKKITIEVGLPSGTKEIVVSYLVLKEKTGWFSNSIVGYTISFSCYKEKFEESKEEIDLIAKGISIL